MRRAAALVGSLLCLGLVSCGDGDTTDGVPTLDAPVTSTTGGSSATEQATTPTTGTPTAETPSAETATAAPPPPPPPPPEADGVLVDYVADTGQELALADGGDTSQMVSSPEGFADYLEIGLVNGVDYAIGRTRSDGWASGVVIETFDGEPVGGYAVIWADDGTTWREVLSGQQEPLCADLTAAGVPAEVLGDPVCREDAQAVATVPYTGP